MSELPLSDRDVDVPRRPPYNGDGSGYEMTATDDVQNRV